MDPIPGLCPGPVGDLGGLQTPVICSMKKANRNKLNTIVRQCVIHVVCMI
jgi:hypothetical protein